MSKTDFSFMAMYSRGEVSEEDIHTFIEVWHDASDGACPIPLHEFLGMSWWEYSDFVVIPDLTLKDILAKRREVSNAIKTED